MTRRLLFRHAAAAVGGYFLLPSLHRSGIARASATPKSTARNCIFILMQGGPSHVDTFDLKDAAYTPPAFDPTDFEGVRFPRGLFPKLAGQMPVITLVRSVRAWAEEHSLAQKWLQIGRNPAKPDSVLSPHIGSVAALELSKGAEPGALPPFVSLNAIAGTHPDAGFLHTANTPFFVAGVSGAGLGAVNHGDGRTRFNARADLLDRLDAGLRTDLPYGRIAEDTLNFHQSARRLMQSSEASAAFTLSIDERAEYGGSAFGNACAVARNLLRRKLGTRFIQVTHGDWDHHGKLYRALDAHNPASMARQFDAGLGQLIADLAADGLLAETLIVAMGEFGRTTGPLNAAEGRDHYQQQAVLIAGGGTRGGRAIGATDETGQRTIETGWGFDRDIRHEDLEATIHSALGIDWTTIRYDHPNGFRFEYVPGASEGTYAPVDELWS